MRTRPFLLLALLAIPTQAFAADEGNAAAAKLRQVLPAMQALLCNRGWQVSAIRIRVQARLA